MPVHVPQTLLFQCVPKTGGSAVAKLLIERYSATWLPARDIRDGEGKKVICRKHSPVSRLVDAEILSAKDRAELVVTATVRNPFDWLVSCYTYSRHVFESSGGDETDVPWILDDISRYRHAARAGFAEHIERYYLQPLSSVVRKYRSNCDHFLRFEKLHADLNALLVKLDLPPSGVLEYYNCTPGRDRDYRIYFSDRLKCKVAAAYSSDLEEFGYEF